MQMTPSRNAVALFIALVMTVSAFADGPVFVSDPQAAAKALAVKDTWVIAQPKEVAPLEGVTFDLSGCKGIVANPGDAAARSLAEWAADQLTQACGVKLPILDASPEASSIVLTLAGEPAGFPPSAGVDASVFERLGQQGYVLVVNAEGVTAAARDLAGLRYAFTTLAQMAADRVALPGMIIRDWPSLEYRGVQQDISRGQVPTTAALNRLADVVAQGKMNILEFYLEHVYKYKAFPDISPPEGLTPDEANDFSMHAARAGVEVHPLFQALGHSFHILSKPQYQHLRIGPCEKAPWIMTFDIRNPEAVQMVATMIDELCETFPGRLFSVDITEIDIDGLATAGITPEQATDLVFTYVLQLNDIVKKHGRRLTIAQGPLDSQGHLAGMGPKLDQLPKDIIVDSYYCAGGPYAPAWEKDFPRFREKGIDFFAQPWIYSHVWLTPWVNRAAEFSELEVSRGLKHSAVGSVTSDWGDAGHFHFVGQEWLPFLYHGACAWTGANMDRDYFRRAFSSVIYGLQTDAAVRAIEGVTDVNGKDIRVRDEDGKEVDVSTGFIWEFFHDPFTHPDIVRMVDPAAVGRMLADAAEPAVAALAAELPKAKRNRDSLEQWLFGARCYAALGHKLVALGHYDDSAIPRPQAAEELEKVAGEYETLQADFKRLWLAEDRDNDGFQDLVKRFTFTSAACRDKAKAIKGEKS